MEKVNKKNYNKFRREKERERERESLEDYYGRRERYLQKPPSLAGHAISELLRDSTVVKECREESCGNMLPVLSEFTQKNFRRTMGL